VAIAVFLWLAQAASTCTACHPRERDAEAGGAHAKAASCVDCHGGDPKETDKERSHGPNLKNKVDRRNLPSLCGSCHTDARKMNPYGLPTDQLAQYVTSKHSESLLRGNLKAAVCIDCHGIHGIRRARDPTSPVHPSRVPATCGTCHGNRDLMEKSGHSWDVEARYRESVHGALLLGKGDRSAPHCATCHGNHGAVPPGYADVGRVCGKCHPRQAELFDTSPHAFYAKDGSFKACVGCHSNHRIVTAPHDMSGRCAPCHEPTDKEMGKFADLGGLIAGARSRFGGTGERVANAARSGVATEEEEGALAEARTTLLELAPLQHSLNRETLSGVAGRLDAQLSEIEKGLDRKEKSERMRKLALIPIWLFLAAMAVLFRLKGRRLGSPR